MKKYKGIIFDFNGVLLLDQHLHDEIWSDIAKKLIGRELTESEFKHNLHGRTNRSAVEYLRGGEASDADVDAVMLEKEHAYQALARRQGDAYHLNDGAIELFENLKKQTIPFTIGTSSPAMNIPFFDELLGLHTWFDLEKIVCDDGTLKGKPAPDIYLKAAAALGFNPKDCVVVEDARSGIAAALHAGIGYIIAIGPKTEHAALAAVRGVSEVIETLREVNVERLFR
ncbi:HAD family phosphatase [Candidatus Kaiserbacteria bacterium]|nr:HAD family phosphatase [Candidatus Kaiserbacteria bacterium]